MLSTELDVLEFWKNHKTFQKSLDNRIGKEKFTFLDGPPFPSGDIHLGHVSTAYPKDTVPRYWTQKGKYAVRRWGWDCHGLPVENFVQKELGVSDRRRIESEIGIEVFNKYCRDNVSQKDDEWRSGVARSGRWVDMDDQYRTMDNDYMESVWWGLGQLWNKNLLYKDYRSSIYVPSMGTTLSQFEINDDIKYAEETIETPVIRFGVLPVQAKKLYSKISEEIVFSYSEQLRYKVDVEKRIQILEKLDEKTRKISLQDLLKSGRPELLGLDWTNSENDLQTQSELDHLKEQLEVIYQNVDTLDKIKLILEKDYSLNLLAWTTTPWSIPANTALAVGPDIEYSVYYLPNTSELVILAEDRVVPILSLHFKDYILNSPNLSKQLENITDSSAYFQKLGVDLVKLVSLKGQDLVGLEYTPLFSQTPKIDSYEEQASVFKVYPADFVSSEDGTGIVHIAPVYGPDDFKLGKEFSLPFFFSLNDFGEVSETLSPELKPAFGKLFTSANPIIVSILEQKNLVFGSVKISHKYPVYNRNNQPVYYCAKENWYIGETRFLDKSLELNQEINWYPSHLKDGRFGLGLETAPNWCISRTRFWGTPIPIWQTADQSKTIFIDSIEKLRSLSVNPIYRLMNTLDLNPEFYEEGKSVIITDAQSKLPLGISATQFRSKNISEMRKGKDLEINKFAEFAQKILDEVLDLFEKYETVQLQLHPEEQQMWTTWLLSLNPASKKTTKVFYFYKKLKEDIDGLADYGPVTMLDLHRPHIDNIVLKDELGNLYNRIPEVMDGWVDSGSMPWASFHYPFENKEMVEKSMPADYIVEYEGQVRGWFHALHVLATAIFGKPAFKNVQVHGTLLGTDGKKMSKSKKNYLSIDEYFGKFGSDAIRLMFLSSPFFEGESLTLTEKEMQSYFRSSSLMISNISKYIYQVLQGFPKKEIKTFQHPLNKWWQAYTQDYISKIDQHMENYNLMEAARLILPYIDNWSTWYVRRSKDLLTSEYAAETAETLRQTTRLFAIYTASLQPFNSEKLWSVVKLNSDPESVHLTDIETVSQINAKQQNLLVKMQEMRELVSIVHSARKTNDIRLRQTLYADLTQFKLEDDLLLDIFLSECNLMHKDLSKTEGQIFEFASNFGVIKIDMVIDEDLAVLGFTRDFERAVQESRKQQGMVAGEMVTFGWKINEIKDEKILQKVLKQVDWTKLCVEIRWLDELPDTKEPKLIEVKELVKINSIRLV
jgi:isoleucyl-tRNA synthetase